MLIRCSKIACVVFCILCFNGALWSQSPRIDAINPPNGPIAGGTVVTVTGSNFLGATLSLDQAAVTPQSISATAIQFKSPAHDNGIASVAVATAAGTAYGEFLYVPPRLQDLAPGSITTVAGIGLFTGYYRLATQAAVYSSGMAFDPVGSLYLAEPTFNRISRIRPDGILVPFAGTEVLPSHGLNVGDGGPAISAVMDFPRGVVADSAGNIYIAD
jgi:hypothetical protein